MAPNKSKIKQIEEVTDTEIRIALIRNGDTFTGLARRWSEELSDELGVHVKVWPENISRVVHRREGFVYPLIRKKLAAYMNVPVEAIGRQGIRPQAEETEQAASAA